MLFPPRRLARIARSARALAPSTVSWRRYFSTWHCRWSRDRRGPCLCVPSSCAAPEPGQCSTPSRSAAAPIDILCPAATTPTGGCEGPSSRRRDPAPARICARRPLAIMEDRHGTLLSARRLFWQFRRPVHCSRAARSVGRSGDAQNGGSSAPNRLDCVWRENRSVILRRCRGRTAACGAANALVNPPIWLMATSDRYCIGSPSTRVRAPTASGRREVKIE
jgi:hypothetical protein